MSNNTIEFNKNYTKLPDGIKTARLVACEPVKLDNQTQSFLHYDTAFLTWGKKVVSLDFSGQDNDYLLLCLISDTGAFFTTLRKDNQENREKYMINLGDSCTPSAFEVDGVPMELTASLWVPQYGKVFNIIIKEG